MENLYRVELLGRVRVEEMLREAERGRRIREATAAAPGAVAGKAAAKRNPLFIWRTGRGLGNAAGTRKVPGL